MPSKEVDLSGYDEAIHELIVINGSVKGYRLPIENEPKENES